MAGYSKPHTATEMDLRLYEFSEHAREEGDSSNIPADARSGLVHFIDALRGQGAKTAWSKNESPERADPLPIKFLLAMVSAALTERRVVAFDWFPRKQKHHNSPSHNGMDLYYSCCR